MSVETTDRNFDDIVLDVPQGSIVDQSFHLINQ